MLTDWDNEDRYAEYDSFIIGNETSGYQVTSLGEMSGDAGNSFKDVYMNKFTTMDRDNDLNENNCAIKFTGAYWHSPTCNDA